MSRDIHDDDNFSRIFREQLDVLRGYGAKFAQENPDLAPYMESGHRKNHDPETERLIESFAFMLAQLETKIIESKTEFGRAALENTFPELVTPTPAMTVLKVEPNRQALERSPENLLPKGTVFHTHNEEGIVCSFSSMLDMEMVRDEILGFSLSDFVFFKRAENQKNNALLLKCDLFPKEGNDDFHEINLFINSEIENALKIHDNLIGNDEFFYIKNNNKTHKIPASYISYDFHYNHFLDKNYYRNFLYPIFDFVRFSQKFNFLKVKIPKKIIEDKYTEFLFPLIFNDDLYLKNNTILNNCVPVINVFDKNLKPIEYIENKKEYAVRSDLTDDHHFEVLSINSVELSDITSQETKFISYFNEEEDILRKDKKVSEKTFDQNKVWSVSRSLYTRSKQSKLSRLYLTIRNRVEYHKKPEQKKDSLYHIFLNGKCSNGVHGENIKSQTAFDYSGALPVKSVYSLLTSSRRLQNKKILANANFVSELLSVNNKISCNYINDINIIKIACQIISMNYEDIFVFVERFFSQSEKITQKETFKNIYRNGIYFQVPCFEFDVTFPKGVRPSIGAFFLKVFFESYFSYVNSFNYELKINISSKKE